ncbi:MAG: hypothetical protein CMO26_21145 [Thiotrichales bacterium]|nr:hypothetical protein [Thiotrichales bacterium]
MPSPAAKPLVCVSASLMAITDAQFLAHVTAEKNIDAVQRFSDCVPIIVPALGDRLQIESFLSHVDGVVLTGGRANVEPHHFDGEPFPDDEPIDPDRDATVLPLVQEAVRMGVPVFGICRGIQELNVALGGSLHYRIHLLPGKNDHRMPRHDDVTTEEVFKLKHTVKLTDGGLLRSLAGTDEVWVNSLHGQGIDRLADCLTVEALSPDGVIEAVSHSEADTFTVGVQWHAEWQPEEHDLSRKLFEAFGEAARIRLANRD